MVEQMYVVVWERELQNGSCPKDSGISEEVKAVRSRLTCVICLPPRAMGMSGPGLDHDPDPTVVCFDDHGS